MISTQPNLTATAPLPSDSLTKAIQASLSPRHVRVLRGIVWGMTPEEIAEWLGMLPHLVEQYTSQILESISARNLADAVRIALTAGFDMHGDPRLELPNSAADRPSGEIDHHLRPLAVDTSASLIADATEQGDSPGADAHFDPPLTRLVGICDSSFDDRVAWIRGWTRVEQCLPYNHWDTRLLSQLDSNFDMLVVHGSQPKRLVNFVRDARRCYRAKLIIAVLTSSLPSDRAVLLRAGADAVYDLSNEVKVVKAWLTRAMERSASHAASARGPLPASASRLIPLLQDVKLTRMEKSILTMLEANAGRVVRYEDLTRLNRISDSIRARKSIQVLISRLQDKLRSEPVIRCIRQEGYTITAQELSSSLKSRVEDCFQSRKQKSDLETQGI